MVKVPKPLIKDILVEYGVDPAQITLLRHNENITYKVIDHSTSKSYLFRVHTPITKNLGGSQHAREGISLELKLLQNITHHSKHLVQTPIQNSSGDLFTELNYLDNQTTYCSLLTWIEGRNLQKDDFLNQELVFQIGVQTSRLHKFLKSYTPVSDETIQSRPQHGIARHYSFLNQIYKGIEKGLFSKSDFNIIAQTVNLINSRLISTMEDPDAWGIIHGDLHMGNILISDSKEIAFIDFGLFGYGHYFLDVAMSALNSVPETRDSFFKGYFGDSLLSKGVSNIVEGFILISIFGYYAYHIDNTDIYPWMRERMPLLCKSNCLPFLREESILYNF
jgi:Ser/Thr protein kinase RdoA (MazF antagonist)